MKPGKYDMEAYRGGTFESGAISRTIDGMSLNFAAYDSITFKIRQPWKHTDDSTLLELSTETGHIVVAGDELSISITIPVSEVDAFEFDSGRYFLDLHTDGAVPATYKLLHGKFTVYGEDDI